VSEKAKGQSIIQKLFEERLIADVEIFENPIKRTYTQNGKVNWGGGDFRVVGLTTDDKINDMITSVVKQEDKGTYPSTDILVTSLATGSKDYILWVKEATEKGIGNDRAEFEDNKDNDAAPDTGVKTDATAGTTAKAGSSSTTSADTSSKNTADTSSKTTADTSSTSTADTSEASAAASSSTSPADDSGAADADSAPADETKVQTKIPHHKKKHHHHKHHHKEDEE